MGSVIALFVFCVRRPWTAVVIALFAHTKCVSEKGKVNARLPDAGTLTPYETTEKSSVLLEVPVAMERHLQAYAPPAVIVNEVIEICCPTAILVLSSSISPPPEVTVIDPCIWHDVPPELCIRK